MRRHGGGNPLRSPPPPVEDLPMADAAESAQAAGGIGRAPDQAGLYVAQDSDHIRVISANPRVARRAPPQPENAPSLATTVNRNSRFVWRQRLASGEQRLNMAGKCPPSGRPGDKSIHQQKVQRHRLYDANRRDNDAAGSILLFRAWGEGGARARPLAAGSWGLINAVHR